MMTYNILGMKATDFDARVKGLSWNVRIVLRRFCEDVFLVDANTNLVIARAVNDEDLGFLVNNMEKRGVRRG